MMPATRSSASDSPDCPACGTAIPPDANFCSHCGAELGDGTLPAYCSTCGDPFERDDEFCTNCGTPRTESDDHPSRSPSRSDPDSDAYRAFRQRVREHTAAGWEIQRDYGDRVTLVDRDIGSIPVHVLLLLFTGGFGNLLYGWYHYSELAETRHLSVDDPESASTSTSASAPSNQTDSTEEHPLTTVAAYVLSAFTVSFGLLLLAAGVRAGTIVLSTVGLVLAAGGFYVAPAVHRRLVAPAVHRRLERRHGITAFGRRRTVDHRVVRPTESCDEPCVVCGEPLDGGLVRRRRDETVIAGVPVRTHEIQYNHYCPACARDDLLGPTVEPDAIDTDEPPFERIATADDDAVEPTDESDATETERSDVATDRE